MAHYGKPGRMTLTQEVAHKHEIGKGGCSCNNADPQKFKDGIRAQPIIYQDELVLAYRNNLTGSIVVVNKWDEKGTVRIDPDQAGLRVTAREGMFAPWNVNGIPGFIVRGMSDGS